MKNILLILLLLCNGLNTLWAQDTLKVVNWNIEYFGARNAYPQRQVNKVISIMQNINADVYALVEIVNKDSLQKVKQALDADYEFIVSPFGSVAPDVNAPNYPSAQKLAFFYKKSKVQVLNARAFMVSSTDAYYNWATGRMPFLIETNIKVGNNWQRLDFQVLHAKAMSDFTSCVRRTEGGKEWKDSLDTYKSNTPFILLGDWNDDFDKSICGGGSSNYTYMLSDSTDVNSYFSPTLNLSKQNISTIDGYPSFIDHVMLSNEVHPWYIPNSAKVLKAEVNAWVSSYTNDVSDHFPVQTWYLPQVITTSSIKDWEKKEAMIYPNPAGDYFTITNPHAQAADVRVMNMAGQTVWHEKILKQSNIATSSLQSGAYLIQLTEENGQRHFHKLVVAH